MEEDKFFQFYSKFDETHGKETRKKWYGDATEAYLEARPRYPDSMVKDSLKEAKLTPDQHVLEIGCGPGIATVPLAKWGGFALTAIDPAPRNCDATRRQCQENGYTNVEVLETTFEDYQKPDASPSFSAIVCSTSFHWIHPDVACQKTAQLLKPTGGCLLLWWVMPPMVSAEVCDRVQDIYDDLELTDLAKHVRQICSAEYSSWFFDKIRTQINDSGCYQPNNNRLELNLSKGHYYTPEKYIALLGTLSQYISLPSEKRKVLFDRLLERLKSICEENGKSELDLTSAYGYQIFWAKQD